MARGIDFYGVNLVINYDFPVSGSNYIHRIGRTGRGDREGEAITFFTDADFKSLRMIANIIKQSGGEVSDWMLNIRQVSLFIYFFIIILLLLIFILFINR